MMDVISKAAGLAWNLMGVIGALTTVGFSLMAVYAWRGHRADQRAARARRDERARTLTPEAAEGQAGLATWLDFVRDHDLPTIPTPTPKEPT